MRATSTVAVLLAAGSLASAQTFSDCNPMVKTCPANPALSTTLTTDFTKGASADWETAVGTTLTYGANGAEFGIKKNNDAPTISSKKYIFFGKVSVVMRSAPGNGIVSSFILESDDLDEVDWEWVGSGDAAVQSNFFGKGNTTTYDRAVYHNVAAPVETYHTYSVEWTAQALKWSIDGNLVRTLNYGDALALGGKNYPQTPMRVKMGSWIGCASIAAQTDPKSAGTCSWAGGAADFSKAPFTQYVKSVSIQDYGCGSEYSYSDNSGSWQSIKTTGDCGGQAVGGAGSVATPSNASAAIFAETSATQKSLSSSATAYSNSSNTASSSSSTLLTITPATTTGGTSAAKPTAASATTSGGAATVSGNAATTTIPKHKYGALDFGVLALGLALGYLVM